MKNSVKKKMDKKIILTIIKRDIEFDSIPKMMRKKEQLLKMGVLTKARITSN